MRKKSDVSSAFLKANISLTPQNYYLTPDHQANNSLTPDHQANIVLAVFAVTNSVIAKRESLLLGTLCEKEAWEVLLGRTTGRAGRLGIITVERRGEVYESEPTNPQTFGPIIYLLRANMRIPLFTPAHHLATLIYY